MELMIRSTSYGEIGIDTEASPGNGPFYVKLYDGSYHAVGFDNAEEAWAELEFCGPPGRPRLGPLAERVLELRAQRDLLVKVLKDCEIALRTVAKSDEEFHLARHQVREVRAALKAVEE